LKGFAQKSGLVISCCEYLENFLSAHADGEVDEEQTRTVTKHLEDCDRCRKMLDNERALKKLLRRTLRAQAPDELRQRIATIIADESLFQCNR
jgi:mycothiol system anti-sigma-R factor